MFRHAERDNSGSDDPGLSRRGQSQAAHLIQIVEKERLPKPHRLIASPKKRSQQTLMPLAEKLSLELTVDEGLDERLHSESNAEFKQRVSKFLQKLEKQKQGNIFICTHLDWVEDALLAIPGDSDLLQEKYQTWSPGQYMEFEINDGVWNLITFGVI